VRKGARSEHASSKSVVEVCVVELSRVASIACGVLCCRVA
jgi:hypothetical protein